MFSDLKPQQFLEPYNILSRKYVYFENVFSKYVFHFHVKLQIYFKSSLYLTQ